MQIKSKTTKVAFAHQGEGATYDGSYELDNSNEVTRIEANIFIGGGQTGTLNRTAQGCQVNLWNGADPAVIAEASALIASILANPLAEEDPAEDPAPEEEAQPAE